MTQYKQLTKCWKMTYYSYFDAGFICRKNKIVLSDQCKCLSDFPTNRSVYKIIVSLNLPKEVTSVTVEISEDTKWNSQVNTLENLTSRPHLFQPSQRLCWHHGELKELRLTIKTFCNQMWHRKKWRRNLKVYANELLVEKIISWVRLKSNGKANDASTKNFDP